MVTDLITYCHQLDSPIIDHFHPLLYQRCLLSDATWISAGVICLVWIFLFLAALRTNPNDDDDGVTKQYMHAKEPHWGRYVPEPVDQPRHYSNKNNHGAMYRQSHISVESTSTVQKQQQQQPSPLVYAPSYSPTSPVHANHNYQHQQYLDPSYYYPQHSPLESEKIEFHNTPYQYDTPSHHPMNLHHQ
ncbi:uncharacterized protein BX664DRAFT_334114 [Halteromyces radiatus]|uniref:uncharacterized protein n=1 Tax=Halteromyces radiatus TaxID=101107 RepID=UPI002220EDEB|nr:uncharacterized protein BX664DRAFT_334114 [Halteromyces radiatus]KAI8089867.1 hypothetical protein BX664DRAFT_334114 [Halteromyces radiatus]